MKSMRRDSGNIFAVLFAATAALGALGYGVTNFVKGPMTSAVKLTRTNTATAQMAMAAQTSVLAATSSGQTADCDGDGYIEPMEYRVDATKPAPLGGGLLPAVAANNGTDPWGNDYGYCVWDHGPKTLDAACRQSGSTNLRLEGIAKKSYPVVAIISSGPDKAFSTTCRNFSTGPARADQNNNGVLGDSGDFDLVAKTTGSDDLIFTYTYEEATGASGGLWALKPADQTTAVIQKGIEAQEARFAGTGTFSRLGATSTGVADCTGLGSGQYTDTATGHCYYSSSGTANWNSARAACAADGGYLASFTSREENDSVNAALDMASVFYWFGANDIVYEGNWTFDGGELGTENFRETTGKPVNGLYSKWRAGEPNGGTNENCLASYSDGKWIDATCNNSAAYVCERDGTPSAPADCGSLGASRFTDSTSGHCYYKSAGNATQSAAAADCASYGDYLASIASEAEYAALKSNLGNGFYWLDGNDAAVEGEWRFAYGENAGRQFWQYAPLVTTGYQNWNAGEPNEYNFNDEDCGEWNGQVKAWNDNACSTADRYICEKNPPMNTLDVANGLRLADTTAMPNCNAQNTGVMRRNGATIEICDGLNWIAQAGGIPLDQLSDVIADYARNNLFYGPNTGSLTVSGYDNALLGTGDIGSFLAAGYGNTGFGRFVLTNIAEADFNTAAGSGAVFSVSDGRNNTGLGREACSGIGASALNNTCVGYHDSGQSASTGMTAIGVRALQNNSGDTHNTAIGGNAAFATTTGTDNTAAGYNALASNVTGASNTAIGHVALNASTGTGNTAIGASALEKTTASNLTAIGAFALNTNVNGTAHTAAGFESLFSQNGGSGSSAFGYQALRANTAGVNNSAIGYRAGYQSLGSDNTLAGREAMAAVSASGSGNAVAGVQAASSSTASNMVAIGYQALYSNTAAGNAGVGYQALYSNTGATGNTALGFGALTLNTGVNNTAAGHRALENNVTGTLNTAIGYQALDKMTAGNGVAVGYQALSQAVTANTAVGNRAGALTTGGDNVAIGASALANGADVNNRDNVAVGAGALYSSTGFENTAVGNRALYSNLETGGNTAVGSTAGHLLTAASNTAIGARALYGSSAPTGAMSTAAGSQAGYSGGMEITAFGYRAGYRGGNYDSAAGYLSLEKSSSGNNTTAGYLSGAATTGASNTVIGARAMSAANAGSALNTAVGAGALESGSGTRNVALGSTALASAGSGSDNYGIGFNAGPTVSGLVNTIALGANAAVTASNSVRLGDTAITKIEGQVAFTAASDARLKTDIEPSDLGLDFIASLKPVSYRMKGGNGLLDYGFLAQDVESSLASRVTNMVTRRDDTMRTYQLRGTDLLAPMVRAVQERQEKIDALKKALQDLAAECSAE